jgi:hypothetical protein
VLRSRGVRLLVGLLLAAMNVVVPLGRTVPPTLAATTTTFCVEGLYSFFVGSSGPVGQVQAFRVVSEPAGFIDFAATTAGPFDDPLLINVTIGSNGQGQTQFIARGLAVGTTTLNAVHVATGVVTNTLAVVVDTVDTITLEPVDSAHTIGVDPNPPEAEAKRFFPDLNTPSSDACRQGSSGACEPGREGRLPFRGRR